MNESDLLIIGAGSAGLTLALLLSGHGLRITVLEQAPAPVAGEVSLKRVSALNLASERLLTRLGVWQNLTAKPAYQAMSVWEADSFAKISFDAHSSQLPSLGSLVDNEELRQALYQQLQACADVRMEFNQRITQISAGTAQNLVTTEQGVFLGRLLVGADGANSQVRRELKMPQQFWDYDHHAVVALVNTSEPHQATARQVFLPTGPLALLPMADPHLVSIVWSTSPEQAKTLLDVDATLFNQQLTAACQSVLGPLAVASDRSSYPLRMRYSTRWIEQNAVLVADAAHTIHPLAGQGMNLGLMDVAALAELILENVSGGKLTVEQRWLRQYERWRKAEAQHMIVLMEAFKRGFMAQNPLAKLVRAVGMRAVDQLPLLKDQLLAAAVGERDNLPQQARPAVIRFS